MRRFDYRCPVCQTVYTDVVTPLDPNMVVFCEECPRKTRLVEGQPMSVGVVCDRQPAAPAFTIKGFNEKNGYSK